MGFYRLVPLLQREANLVQIAVETGDLSRHSSSRSKRHETTINIIWKDYSNGGLKTSAFLRKVGDVYGIRA